MVHFKNDNKYVLGDVLTAINLLIYPQYRMISKSVRDAITGMCISKIIDYLWNICNNTLPMELYDIMYTKE